MSLQNLKAHILSFSDMKCYPSSNTWGEGGPFLISGGVSGRYWGKQGHVGSGNLGTPEKSG